MFLIKAYAEVNGASKYERAVASQYAKQYGVSNRAALKATRKMANGRTPFQPSKGRSATNTSIAAQARRLAKG